MGWSMNYSQTISTPAGDISVTANEKSVTKICFGKADLEKPNPLTQKASNQLKEYFAGKRTEFNLPIEAQGTDFQKSVWAELLKIPAGKTKSYGEIARLVGKPKAARAVGGAVGSNPIAVVIPCHRVMAASGAITGYTGGNGVTTKRQLLDLEGVG